ncbi:MAG: Rieske 2Fe-2S domain-containing protein [Pirellulales bacterium]
MNLSDVSQSDLMVPPPAIHEFPRYPLSWYLFGRAKDVRSRPVTRQVLGRELVGFQTASGRIAILNARCGHQGADLGRGQVVGDAIQCPFHNWEYGPDGRCIRIPAQAEIPPHARQVTYPVEERHGYLYFFNAPHPLFSLPFLSEGPAEEFVAGKLLRFIGRFSWYMAAGNTFDCQHWSASHNRAVHGRPKVDCPDPYARRIRFRAAVVGNSIFDRALRRFAGDSVDVSITNWGGSFNLVTGSFQRVCSRLVVSYVPLNDGESLEINVIVLARRRQSQLGRALIQPLSLWLRYLFTWGFVADEFDRVVGIRYSPQTLIDADGELIELFRWAAALPEEEAGTWSTCPSPEFQPTGQQCAKVAFAGPTSLDKEES